MTGKTSNPDGSRLLEQLKSDGWQRQFTASGSRLQEAIENYRALGFEVKAIPARELAENGCTVCFDDEHDQTMVIFTKRPGAPADRAQSGEDDGGTF
jgi:hypothetical protein